MINEGYSGSIIPRGKLSMDELKHVSGGVNGLGPYLVDSQKCTGCGACAASCKVRCIEIISGCAKISPCDCTACGACYNACPAGAIIG